MNSACSIQVRGVVQGVGFRPFVYRLAQQLGVSGWVFNGEEGVTIHAEAPEPVLAMFIDALKTQAPPAATISAIEVQPAEVKRRTRLRDSPQRAARQAYRSRFP